MKYLRENTLDVRIFSIDEAFVEISGLAKLQGLDLDDYLSHLQKDILENI
jgi:nucleotidyltransferase/DNA polymerase involved in DNA repair